MRRLSTAPNLALATLWADQLRAAGIETTVQRIYNSGIAGEIPPDQALPEIWVTDDEQLERARTMLHELQHLPDQRWVCGACGELVEGPFEQCWQCGAMK